MSIAIVPLTETTFDEFVGLMNALADYERLPRPDDGAVARLKADASGSTPRFEAALAIASDGRAIGYAIWFETYSSFLAKPTMYLEDLFVLETARGAGAGGRLFEHLGPRRRGEGEAARRSRAGHRP